jgi:hypothetical protein
VTEPPVGAMPGIAGRPAGRNPVAADAGREGSSRAGIRPVRIAFEAPVRGPGGHIVRIHERHASTWPLGGGAGEQLTVCDYSAAAIPSGKRFPTRAMYRFAPLMSMAEAADLGRQSWTCAAKPTSHAAKGVNLRGRARPARQTTSTHAAKAPGGRHPRPHQQVHWLERPRPRPAPAPAPGPGPRPSPSPALTPGPPAPRPAAQPQPSPHPRSPGPRLQPQPRPWPRLRSGRWGPGSRWGRAGRGTR